MLSPEPQLEMKQFGTPAQPETLCDDVQLPGKVLGRAAGTVTPFLGLRGHCSPSKAICASWLVPLVPPFYC